MPGALRMLAMEAGGTRISAAAFEGAVCVGRVYEDAPQKQTERLAPLVAELLAGLGWNQQPLAAVAVGRGPGSFTGLRSSLALGQGLGLVSGARLIGVDTLTTWAQASGQTRVAIALDGRRGQAYFGRFEKKNEIWGALEAPALVDQTQAWELSEGWPLLTDLEASPASLPLPQGADLAVAVGQLAWQRWQDQTGRALDWEPLYLRRAEVEILWEKLHPKVG